MKQLWDKLCNFAKKCKQFELWKVVFKNFIEKRCDLRCRRETWKIITSIYKHRKQGHSNLTFNISYRLTSINQFISLCILGFRASNYVKVAKFFIYILFSESFKVRRFCKTSPNFIPAKSQFSASFNFPKFAETHFEFDLNQINEDI